MIPTFALWYLWAKSRKLVSEGTKAWRCKNFYIFEMVNIEGVEYNTQKHAVVRYYKMQLSVLFH